MDFGDVAAERLEQYWRSRDASSPEALPRLTSFLPFDAHHLSAQTLRGPIELLACIDLENRWKHAELVPLTDPIGPCPRANSYTVQYPELGQASQPPLSLIVAEYQARRVWTNQEESIRGEFVLRYPTLIASLQPRFDAIDLEMGRNDMRDSNSGGRLDRFGDYRNLVEIGRGGMGIVYRAQQVGLDRTVALKMILPGTMASDNQLQRLRHEAEVLATLKNPGIVPLYEIGRNGDCLYFTMAYIRGVDLERRVKDEGPISPRQAAEVIRQVSETIWYAHRMKVIHRDLKPSNIVLDADEGDRPKVLDFGLSKRLDRDDNPTSAEGQILGTLCFSAPEVILGRSDKAGLDEMLSVDIYSLGAVLYYMTTGNPPFRATSPEETIRLITESECLSPRLLNPEIDRDLNTICLKCLRKSPRERYRSAWELARDLERYLAGKPIWARPVARWERVLKWVRRKPSTSAVLLLSSILVTSPMIYLTREREARAKELVDRVLVAEFRELPGLIDSLTSYGTLVEPTLKSHLSSTNPNVRFRAALCLASGDLGLSDYLYEKLLDAEPDQFNVILEIIKRHDRQLVPRLWGELSAAECSGPRQIRSACALAALDAASVDWSRHAISVVRALFGEDGFRRPRWTVRLTPVREALYHVLDQYYEEPETPDDGVLAAEVFSLLLDAKSESDAEKLVSLIVRANQDQFDILMKTEHEEILPCLRNALKECEKMHRRVDTKKYAEQSLRLLTSLARLGDNQPLWRWLEQEPDPLSRSYLIERVASSKIDPRSIALQLNHAGEHSLRDLILMLGQYSDEALAPDLRHEISSDLILIHRSASSSGVHHAAEWLLRRWGMNAEVDASRELIRRNLLHSTTWYISSSGLDMIVLAPGTRGRIVAISTYEITQQIYLEFLKNSKTNINFESNYTGGDPMRPADHVSYYDAVRFCRWLSEREGIESSEWCYPDCSRELDFEHDLGSLHGRHFPNFLDLTGYRLPTIGEWRAACRAGTPGELFFGDDPDLLRYYAWHMENAQQRSHRVGMLKPNPLGFFDIFGNVAEWCVDENSDNFIQNHIIGGYFGYSSVDTKINKTFNLMSKNALELSGFRIARTLVPSEERP